MSESIREKVKSFDATGLVAPYLKVAGDLGVGSYAVKMEDAEFIARLAFHEGMMAVKAPEPHVMSEPHEQVAALADKLRRSGPTGITLGHTMIEWTKQCWRDERYREDARVIMDAFPEDFQ